MGWPSASVTQSRKDLWESGPSSFSSVDKQIMNKKKMKERVSMYTLQQVTSPKGGAASPDLNCLYIQSTNIYIETGVLRNTKRTFKGKRLL